MASTFNLNQVNDALKSHICNAAQGGLQSANYSSGQTGKFEEKFQSGFVQTFRGQQAAFPAHLGTVGIVSINATPWSPGGNV